MPNTQDEIIDFSILFRASTESVFDAVATACGVNNMATIAVGAAIFLRWENWGLDNFSECKSATISQSIRPSQLSFVWLPRNNTPTIAVAFTFSAHEEGTLVRLIESGFVALENELTHRAAAWAQALIAMKFYLENPPA